jgi:hypothetical protein
MTIGVVERIRGWSKNNGAAGDDDMGEVRRAEVVEVKVWPFRSSCLFAEKAPPSVDVDSFDSFFRDATTKTPQATTTLDTTQSLGFITHDTYSLTQWTR